MPHQSFAAGVLLVTLLIAPGAQASPPPFAPMDVFALQWADNPVLSPDGRKLVYERQFFDSMKDVRRSNLWLLDSATGAAQPLTTGSVSDGQVAWSPDATRIAYVSSDEGKAQIYVRWLDSGATARITQLERGPSNLAWSPDGRQLAYTALVPSAGEPLASMPKPPKGARMGAAGDRDRAHQFPRRWRRLRRSGIHSCLRRRRRRRRAAPAHPWAVQCLRRAGVVGGRRRPVRLGEQGRRCRPRSARIRDLPGRTERRRDAPADHARGSGSGAEAVAGRQAPGLPRFRRQGHELCQRPAAGARPGQRQGAGARRHAGCRLRLCRLDRRPQHRGQPTTRAGSPTSPK